jgi:hypothetical protein
VRYLRLRGTSLFTTMATFAEYVFLHIANAVPDESFQSLKENEVFAREFPRRPKCRLPVHARPPLFLCREVNIAMVSNSKRFHAVLRTLCVHRSAKIGTRFYLINYLLSVPMAMVSRCDYPI